ncbi:MAG: DUF4430 domain-containing protein [Clostridiales bacterium]|nr:DUF4430 domain-containing protein [Clostridiales bacterium]
MKKFLKSVIPVLVIVLLFGCVDKKAADNTESLTESTVIMSESLTTELSESVTDFSESAAETDKETSEENETTEAASSEKTTLTETSKTEKKTDKKPEKAPTSKAAVTSTSLKQKTEVAATTSTTVKPTSGGIKPGTTAKRETQKPATAKSPASSTESGKTTSANTTPAANTNNASKPSGGGVATTKNNGASAMRYNTTSSNGGTGSSPDPGYDSGGDITLDNNYIEPIKKTTAANKTEKTASEVTISINCKNAVDYGIRDKAGYNKIIPEDGVILKTSSAEISDGETVLSVLKKVLDKNGIALNAQRNYIKGIGGLNEKDCGGTSGWLYSVNGEFPQVSVDQYHLKNGDKIEFHYTVKNGDVKKLDW